jgi:hypothetical protein
LNLDRSIGRYVPHRLVNLNPFLNAGVLPDVKQRIYEAVHAAAAAGQALHRVLDSEPWPPPMGGAAVNGSSSPGAAAAAAAALATSDGVGNGAGKSSSLALPLRPALGFRCVEHITYPPGVGLDEHEDEDSTYTVSVLLSDQADYEGGRFTLLGNTHVRVRGQDARSLSACFFSSFCLFGFLVAGVWLVRLQRHFGSELWGFQPAVSLFRVDAMSWWEIFKLFMLSPRCSR